MGKNYMAEVAADFFQRLDDMQEKLSTFSGEIDGRREKAFDVLRKFAEQSETPLQKKVSAKKGSALEKAAAEAVKQVQDAMSDWQAQIERSRKGTEFMHKHEKHLLVLVFGAVKAGKSSLGNFFAGKPWMETEFDNAYKRHALAEFVTEDEKRATGGITVDDKGRRWFAEGDTDTTGNMQYFSLSGLRWMDSPGTGAVAKLTDKQDGRSMDEMVQEYLPYTDMCIFLMNSSEPGLMEDMKYICQLHKENQTALVVITKSDVNDEDEDDNGNLVIHWIPKDKETRRRQEEHICRQIKEKSPDIPPEKYSAISVSSILSREGLINNNEAQFKEGNIDTLMKLIAAKTGDNAIKLKQEKPKKTLNAFIENIIADPDGGVSVAALRENFLGIRNEIESGKKKLDDKKAYIVKDIQKTMELTVKSQLRKWGREVDTTGKDLSDAEISKRLMEIISPQIAKEINEAVGDIITSYREQAISPLQMKLKTNGIHKEIKEQEKSYEEAYYEERDPEGFWENVLSFFGKKYYDRFTKTSKVKQSIDMGTNVNSFIESILPMLQEVLEKHITENIDNIKNTYFVTQEKYTEDMLKKLDGLEKQFRALKY
ncbi:MAG: hypothetical protein Q4D07_08290 [Selenomonadaceae bacterium]|nr:hypothetical protein [Selenomonadaceae bacterium]